MKIVFIYKGRYQIRDTVTIEYLSAISKKYGHDTGLVFDQDVFGVTDNVASIPFLNGLLSNSDKVLKGVVKKGPDMAVFLDGFNRGRWNGDMSGKIEGAGKGIIRVGIFYRDPGRAGKGYDYVLVGEPEYAFERFLSEKIFSSDKGSYKFKGLADLDAIPLPDKGLFAPFIDFGESYLLYTSKGCPYHCSYCEETIYKDILGEGYFRRRSPANVISELEEAKRRFGAREVIYKDSVFALDKEWLSSYLKAYKERISAPYKCFGKAEIFDDELALMLKESGCYCVEFGVQTFNEALKKNILGREEKTGDLMKAFSACDRAGLRYDTDHMFGIPGERTEDHIKAAGVYADLKCLNRIKCHNLVYYKGAKIREHAPRAVREDGEYRADFFSSVAGEGRMVETNYVFQKYYKTLPLLPKRFNLFILKKNNWRIFKYVPYVLVVMLMLILAIKNKDKRFKVYFNYYPKKIKHALAGY